MLLPEGTFLRSAHFVLLCLFLAIAEQASAWPSAESLPEHEENSSNDVSSWIIGGGEAVVDDKEFQRARAEFDRVLAEIKKYLDKKSGALSASDLSSTILNSAFGKVAAGLSGKPTLELIQLYLSWAQDAAFRIAGTDGDQNTVLGSVGQPETYYEKMRKLSERANEIEKAEKKSVSVALEDAIKPADTSIRKTFTSAANVGPSHMLSADEVLDRAEASPISENSEKIKELQSKVDALLKSSKASLTGDPQGTLDRIQSESGELWSIYSGLNQDNGSLSTIDNKLRELSELETKAQKLASEKFFETDPVFAADWRNLLSIRSRMKGDADPDSAVKWMKEAHSIEAKLLQEMNRPPRRPFPEHEHYLSLVVREIEQDFEAITGNRIPTPLQPKPGPESMIPPDFYTDYVKPVVEPIVNWFYPPGGSMPSGGTVKGDGDPGSSFSDTPSDTTVSSGVSPVQHESQNQPSNSVTNEELANVFNSVKPDTTGSAPNSSTAASSLSPSLSNTSAAAGRGFGPDEGTASSTVGNRLSAIGSNVANSAKHPVDESGSGASSGLDSSKSDRSDSSSKSAKSNSIDEGNDSKSSRLTDDTSNSDEAELARSKSSRASQKNVEDRYSEPSSSTSVPRVIPKSNLPPSDALVADSVAKPSSVKPPEEGLPEVANAGVNSGVKSIGRKSKTTDSTPTYSLGGASIDPLGGVDWQPSASSSNSNSNSTNSPGLYNASARNGGPGSVSPVMGSAAVPVSYGTVSGADDAGRGLSSTSDASVANALAGIKENGVAPQLASIDQLNPEVTQGTLQGIESLVERTIGRVGSLFGVGGKSKSPDLDDFLGAGTAGPTAESMANDGSVADPLTGERFDPNTGKPVAKAKTGKAKKANVSPAPADLSLKKWLTYLYGI